ncbi:hypothetical protein [Tenacibaculum phage JQ]|nr:hypothetical protein [Tenacibaculum phage JQ]
MNQLDKHQEKLILNNLQFQPEWFYKHELDCKGYDHYELDKTFEIGRFEVDLKIDLRYLDRKDEWLVIDDRQITELTIKYEDEGLNDFVYYDETEKIKEQIIKDVNYYLAWA